MHNYAGTKTYTCKNLASRNLFLCTQSLAGYSDYYVALTMLEHTSLPSFAELAKETLYTGEHNPLSPVKKHR